MGLFTLLSLGLAFAGPPSVLPGAPALQFSLQAVNEETAMELVNKPVVALSDFAGLSPAYPRAVTVLYFCTRKDGGDGLAALERTVRRYRGREVQVVAILGDQGEMGPLADWLSGLDLSFPVLRDHHRIVSDRYGVSTWPLTFVIDGQGDVFAVGDPKGEQVEAELGQAVDALLAGAAAP